MGRTKRWAEVMQSKFPAGIFARIKAVLKEGEDRTDFVREAVERELQRRKAPDVVVKQKTTGGSRPGAKR